jgi:putative glycosyltransferase (TIGR04372 family)
LGLLESHEFGDLLCNVIFLSTLANQFDDASVHVKFRDIRPYSRPIMSLSPWINSVEPLNREWPKLLRDYFPHINPRRNCAELGSQEMENPRYDMVITSFMARDEAIHALPNPVSLQIPLARGDEFVARLASKGLNSDRWFAVVHHRESTYQYRPGGTDRDSDANAFDTLIDHIIALGGQAVRLGHPGMTPFKHRDDFVDLSAEPDGFLLQTAAVSHARFAIVGPSGAMAMTTGFLIPTTLVDAVDTVGMWGPSDVLTHVVKTPDGQTLRNKSLLDAGLLHGDALAKLRTKHPGYDVRKANAEELKAVATKLFERTTNCPGWRPPAPLPSSSKPNSVSWPLKLTHDMPWVNL